MKSIRRRLTVWLLGSLTLLWLGVSVGIYTSVQHSLLKTVDAELAVSARTIRFSWDQNEVVPPDAGRPRGRKPPPQRLFNFEDPASALGFQIWTVEGELQESSASLSDVEMPVPGPVSKTPVFTTLTLEGGERYRAMQYRIGSPGRGKGGNRPGSRGSAEGASGNLMVSIVRDLQSVDQALSSLLSGILIVGGIAAAGGVVLVGLSLSNGLRPLKSLAEQTRSIDAENLHARFENEEAPVELRPVYEQLNDLIHRLETSFERERRFSSDLAHEMRTPVAELRMLSEVALKWPDESEEDTHTDTLAIANQLDSMIENLLALARWESGDFEFQREPVSLEAIVRKLWGRFSLQAEKKNLDAGLKLLAGNAVLETDEGMFSHILSNLLSNAVEYTPEGGRIRCLVHADGMEVINSAPDLTEEMVTQMFERYWRADVARSDGVHSGLGLSLARSCARALGLTLTAQLDGGELHIQLKDEAASSSHHGSKEE